MKQFYTKTFFLFFLLLAGLTGKAQQSGFNTQPDDTFNFPYYAQMMENPDANFFDIDRAFEKYWSNRDHHKVGGYKPYKRWAYFTRTRIAPDGSLPVAGHNMNEYLNYFGSWNALYSTASLAGTWTEIGPKALPTNSTGQPNGLGRINAIAVHPTNGNVIFVGAPAGGIWKSSNHGTTWSSNTDNLPTLGVSAIVIDYSNPSNMWIGTGDRDASDAKGVGVMKSTDGGNTWNTSNSGMGSLTVGEMVQNPKNPNMLQAATSSGIYKSANGGTSWVKKTTTRTFKTILYHPTDTSILYAASDSSFFRSANSGETWTVVSNGLSTAGKRLVIGVTPANPSKVYVLVANTREFRAFYMSTDNGLSFSMRSNSPNILGYASNGSDSTKGQAFYDLCMAVDTADENVVYVGGINIFRSTDGGQTWAINAHWTGSGGAPPIHADVHCLTISKATNELFAGCDGGIYYTADGGGSWNDISNGLAIGQIYKIGQSTLTKNLVINGYQDNGTALLDGSTFITIIGGDGMECVIDPTNDNYMWGALYYGDIRRSSNKGNNFSNFAGKGTNGITEDGDWVTPYILHRTSPNTMFIGYKNVWRTNNAKAGTPTFSVISDTLAGTNSQNIRVLEQSAVNTNILYMVRNDNKLFRTDNCMATKPTWINLTSSLPVAALASDIKTHPKYDSVVYMAINNKVYRSGNFGQSWTNISGSLPNVAMNTLVLDKKGSDAIYVGSDLGVFYRDSTMNDWIAFKTGLPATSEITELEIWYAPVHTNSRIRAATYGRGLWESDLYTSPTSPPVLGFYASDSTVCANTTVNFTDQTGNAPNKWKWSFSPNTVSFTNSTNDSSQNPSVKFTAAGTYSVTLTAYNTFGNASLTGTNMITVYAQPSVNVTASPNVPCQGQTSQLTATGALTYSWNPDPTLSSTTIPNPIATPVFTTTYTVTGTDSNGCSNTAAKTVAISFLPIITIAPAAPTIISGQQVTLVAGGAVAYIWSPPTGLNNTTNDTVIASPAVTTTYSVVGLNPAGCQDTNTVKVTVTPNSTYALYGRQGFANFYPNPVHHNQLFVEIETHSKLNMEIEVVNMMGQTVLSLKQAEPVNVLNMEHIATGMYMLVMREGGEVVLSKPLGVTR